jgi:hypothetical protein
LVGVGAVLDRLYKEFAPETRELILEKGGAPSAYDVGQIFGGTASGVLNAAKRGAGITKRAAEGTADVVIPTGAEIVAGAIGMPEGTGERGYAMLKDALSGGEALDDVMALIKGLGAGTPAPTENFVERRDTPATTPVSTAPTTTTETPTTPTTGESGSGEGGGREIDWDALTAFLSGGAGQTSTAAALAGGSRGLRAEKQRREEMAAKREGLQLQREELEIRRELMEEENRLRALADLYPSIAAEAEAAWAVEKAKLEKEAGKGFWNTDIFWRSEAEAIEASKIQFMNDYIQNKTRSMGLGGKGTVGEAIQDFSSYNPS